MRISDRSSDVCSSDLIDHAHVRDADVLVAAVLLVVRDTDMWSSKETRAVRLGGRACRRTTIEAMHRVPPLRCCVPVSQARGIVCDGPRPQLSRLQRAHRDGPVFLPAVPPRSEDRSLGTDGVRTCISRWSPFQYKK